MRRSAAAVGSGIFFALAPGAVAGLVPWLLTGWHRGVLPAAAAWLSVPFAVLGGILVVAGAIVVVAAFVRFVTEGLGTPAPLAPPERLVIGGLYRFVRNPMYVAVLACILGQALLLVRPVLLVYGALAGLAMFGFVRLHEEPYLTQRFGAEYVAYRRAVRGWWPRLRPWSPSGADR